VMARLKKMEYPCILQERRIPPHTSLKKIELRSCD
jgi:hypothetical protein